MSYIRPEGRSKQHLLRPETTLLVTLYNSSLIGSWLLLNDIKQNLKCNCPDFYELIARKNYFCEKSGSIL